MEGGHRAAFHDGETFMRKYLLAWLLGVPVGLLILIYLFTHLL